MIHTFDHLVLRLQKSGIVKWDLDVACEGGSHVVAKWTQPELKFVRLSENGVDENGFL